MNEICKILDELVCKFVVCLGFGKNYEHRISVGKLNPDRKRIILVFEEINPYEKEEKAIFDALTEVHDKLRSIYNLLHNASISIRMLAKYVSTSDTVKCEQPDCEVVNMFDYRTYSDIYCRVSNEILFKQPTISPFDEKFLVNRYKPFTLELSKALA